MTNLRISFRTAPALLFFSGFSALIYQLVWLRLLSVNIGMTSAAAGAVFAAVFLGMALGAWLSDHLPQRFSGRLTTFAVVEAIVGLSALMLMPLLLDLGEWLSLLPPWGSHLWFKFCVAALLLSLPAAGLGAAYPLLATATLPQAAILHTGLGKLYGLHTLGAVAGICAAAFVLIPAWGLDGALYCAVAVNLSLALTAAYLASKDPDDLQSQTIMPAQRPATSKFGLAVLCISGLSAAAVEIGWTKYLAIYTGSTLYGFALLLAIILSGIAIGSWLGTLLLRRVVAFETLVPAGLMALALGLLTTRSALGMLPNFDGWLISLEFTPGTEMVLHYAAGAAVLMPAALLYGALFPISLSYYCGSSEALKQRVGQGYAANTLAGVLGAVLAGLWLLPSYGTDQLLWLSAIVVILTTLLFVPAIKQSTMRVALGSSVILIGAVSFVLPGLDFEQLIINEELRNQKITRAYTGEPKLLFLTEGRTGVISLLDYDGITLLKNNSLNEAHLELKRARTEILLGLLPQLIQPDAKDIFLVGYGAGTTAKVLAATESLNIRIVELEPAIIEAMTRHEGAYPQILRNPNVSLDIDDARNVLLRESLSYDVILSQPSHSWRSGSGALFSQEYFHIAHSRLRKGGLFGMWLNLFQMDRTTLRAALKTFFSEFPKGAVFINNTTAELLLFGSDEPMVLDYDKVAERLSHTGFTPYKQAINVATPDHIIRNFFFFTSETALAMAGDSQPITDLNLLAETRLAWLKGPPTGDEDPIAMLQAHIASRR